jgi:hypothetical protein
VRLPGTACFRSSRRPVSDLDLGLRWRGGHLYKRTLKRTDVHGRPEGPGEPKEKATGWHAEGNKAAWQHEIKRIDAYVKQHPDWPQIIYMTWDEPGYGPHGMPGPKMAWVKEVLPNAWTTLGAHSYVFDKILPYYTMPNFDDPADRGRQPKREDSTVSPDYRHNADFFRWTIDQNPFSGVL